METEEDLERYDDFYGVSDCCGAPVHEETDEETEEELYTCSECDQPCNKVKE